MLAVFIGSLVILFKKDIITQTRNQFMWLFFGRFFIVTSFYITRNIVSFGIPFYSINMYHLRCRPMNYFFLSSDFGRTAILLRRFRGHIKSWPQVETLEALKSYIREQAIKYGVLDIGSISHRRKIFQNYFTFDTTSGLRPTQPISGFTLLGRDPQPPGLFVIYKFEWDKF